MTVTIDQILAGIIKYIDTEIAMKANGITKFMVYFFAPSIPKMVQTKFDEMKSMGLMDEFIDENGNINLDKAYGRAKEAISRAGKILIPKINYFVDASDVDILYNLIKGV